MQVPWWPVKSPCREKQVNQGRHGARLPCSNVAFQRQLYSRSQHSSSPLTDLSIQNTGVQIQPKLSGRVLGISLQTTKIGEEEIPHHIPTLEPLGRLKYYRRGSRHTFFSPFIPPSGREVYAWYLIAKQRTTQVNFNFFADFHIFSRRVAAIELVVFATG